MDERFSSCKLIVRDKWSSSGRAALHFHIPSNLSNKIPDEQLKLSSKSGNIFVPIRGTPTVFYPFCWASMLAHIGRACSIGVHYFGRVSAVIANGFLSS